jgi:hypothetical protein
MKIKNNLGHEIIIPKHQESIIKYHINNGNHDFVSNMLMNVSNDKNQIIMHPGMNYTFPGQYVTEYPMMQPGGQKFNMYNYMGNLNGYPLKSPNVVKPIYNIGSKQQPIIDNTRVVKPVIDYFNDSQYKKGVEYTQNQANKAKEFHTLWMNSPMYKEMLQKSDPVNAETIEKNRWNNYNNIKLNYNPNQMHDGLTVPGAASFSDDGHIEVYPKGVEDNVSGVGTHEVSHSIDKPINFFKFLLINKQRNIPQKDINKMQNYSNYNKTSKNENLTSDNYKEYPEFYNYVATPTETRARLNDIRQHAYESKLYDPFTQKVTPEIFKKLKDFKFEKEQGWDPLHQLQHVYSNDEIMDLLNSVSKNNTDNNLSIPYAAFGGQMMRSGGSKNPTKYVTNPNSRSLKMYNDSLYNYNNAARIKNDYIRGWNNMQVIPTMSQDDFESNAQNIFNNISRVNNGTPAGLIFSDNDLPNANPYFINDRYGRSRSTENIAPDFNFVEPVQPIELKKVSPKMQYLHPQYMQPSNNISIQGQPMQIQPMTLPQQKGRPVYGPGTTIIGYSNDNMKFSPAYQYTGAPNNEFNLQDKELLNNPELLKQYIYNQDSGYHYKGGGEMIKRADGSYSKHGLWDNIRAAAGSGKAPTAQMLEQERKIRNKYQEGGSIPVIEGPSGYMNEDGMWITDNETIKKQAKQLGAKKVLTEGGSLIVFDNNWNIVGVDDNPNASYRQGGGVTLNAGGEQHRIYVKSTNRGEGDKGHIMVNHPTMDKGMWDTIDLTQKAGARTIAQGVAATKEWHRENPYMKEFGGDVPMYANGGGIPERYKNMGFTHVGQKKQGDGKHKWKVLAKKGDQYKVVQGGWRGMQDFKQHHSQQRKENFWNRMGGRNSSKATDPFSPLYWHKRLGTWENGGQTMAIGGQTMMNPVTKKDNRNWLEFLKN